MGKKILRIVVVIGVVLVVGMGIFAVVVAMQPAGFKVVRSTTIDAPPEVVFDQVNDFHKWENWSPWEKLDPAMKRTHEGPPSGKDAIYGWVGNDKAGEGKMTITQSKPPELIKIKLEFTRPMQDAADVEFDFQEEGKQTKVTWSMSGQNEDFVSKAFCLCMNMDKLIGRDFDKGLANMKELLEKKGEDAGKGDDK